MTIATRLRARDLRRARDGNPAKPGLPEAAGVAAFVGQDVETLPRIARASAA